MEHRNTCFQTLWNTGTLWKGRVMIPPLYESMCIRKEFVFLMPKQLIQHFKLVWTLPTLKKCKFFRMSISNTHLESANFFMISKAAANLLYVWSIYIIRKYKTEKTFEISWENREKTTHRSFFNLEWTAFCANYCWKCFSLKVFC